MSLSKNIEDYLAEDPNRSILSYLEDYGMEAWNTQVSQLINRRLKETIWPKGAALVGYRSMEEKKVWWHYANDRYETECINEIFVISARNGKLITDIMQLIFTVGDKVFVQGQYGVLIDIFDIENEKFVDKTEIGLDYIVKVEGIDINKLKF